VIVFYTLYGSDLASKISRPRGDDDDDEHDVHIAGDDGSAPVVHKLQLFILINAKNGAEFRMLIAGAN